VLADSAAKLSKELRTVKSWYV